MSKLTDDDPRRAILMQDLGRMNLEIGDLRAENAKLRERLDHAEPKAKLLGDRLDRENCDTARAEKMLVACEAQRDLAQRELEAAEQINASLLAACKAARDELKQLASLAAIYGTTAPFYPVLDQLSTAIGNAEKGEE